VIQKWKVQRQQRSEAFSGQRVSEAAEVSGFQWSAAEVRGFQRSAASTEASRGQWHSAASEVVVRFRARVQRHINSDTQQPSHAYSTIEGQFIDPHDVSEVTPFFQVRAVQR